jgi:hypothetical protein
VAFLTIDQKRITAGRNGLLPCLVHKNYQPPKCWDFGSAFMAAYGKCLASWIFKAGVFTLSLAFLAIGIWGTLSIRQKFDPILLLPSDSYLREFVQKHDADYPTNGWSAEVYMSEIDGSSMAGMDRLTTGLQALVDNRTHLRAINSWWPPLKEYAMEKKNFSSWEAFSQSENFSTVLSDFLFSKEGSSYKYNFKFSRELSCREPAPSILAAKFSIDYFTMEGPEQHIPAKRAVQLIVNESGVANVSFSHVKIYAAWETDEIIGFELMRNVGMSMGCVMIVTVLLLVNIPISFYVFSCVVATLIDLVGFLHFWNMTIDIITCVNIVLAIGLCVDYVVHIGHAYLVAEGEKFFKLFLTNKMLNDNRFSYYVHRKITILGITSGSRHQRALKAVEEIGPAVFNGGFTTFLALALLGFSTSQIFLTFFKVCT